MDATIDAYLAFMRQEPQAVQDVHLQGAEEALRALREELRAIQANAR